MTIDHRPVADVDRAIEIRVLAATVSCDSEILVDVRVPGYDEPVRLVLEGTEDTLLATWDESRPIDLEGKTATDRRLLEIVNRRIGRLSRELERARRIEARLWREHREQEAEAYRRYLLASPELIAALPELRGKCLGCWCKGTQGSKDVPCHPSRSRPGPNRRIVAVVALDLC